MTLRGAFYNGSQVALITVWSYAPQLSLYFLSPDGALHGLWRNTVQKTAPLRHPDSRNVSFTLHISKIIKVNLYRLSNGEWLEKKNLFGCCGTLTTHCPLCTCALFIQGVAWYRMWSQKINELKGRQDICMKQKNQFRSSKYITEITLNPESPQDTNDCSLRGKSIWACALLMLSETKERAEMSFDLTQYAHYRVPMQTPLLMEIRQPSLHHFPCMRTQRWADFGQVIRCTSNPSILYLRCKNTHSNL